VHPLRSARSFQPRRRGLPPARVAAYERQAAVWTLTSDGEVLDLAALFGREAPSVVLDIGFGGGEGLIDLAAVRPDECIIGVEVHTPGVARVLDAVDTNGWTHVRVVEDDVLDFIVRVPLDSLVGVRMWFPDPWLKNKQKHRRLARLEVIAALTDRLRVGGQLHVATDIDDYARQVLDVVAHERRLAGGVVPRPEWRPVTRFETRGLREGRTATDLIYERMS
jgi:tRNA (guanine-N7-)-methyltransferase